MILQLLGNDLYSLKLRSVASPSAGDKMPRLSRRRAQPNRYDRAAASTRASIAACGRLSKLLFKPALRYCVNSASTLYEALFRHSASSYLNQQCGGLVASESVPSPLECTISKDEEPNQHEILHKILQSLKERPTITRDEHDRWEATTKSKMVWEEDRPKSIRQKSKFTGEAVEKTLPGLKRNSSFLDNTDSSPSLARTVRPRTQLCMNSPECAPFKYKSGKFFISEYEGNLKALNARPIKLTTDMLNEKALKSMLMAPPLEEILSLGIDIDSKHPTSDEFSLDMLPAPSNGVAVRNERTLENLVAADSAKLEAVRSTDVDMNNKAAENGSCEDKPQAIMSLKVNAENHGADRTNGVGWNNQAAVNKLSKENPQSILALIPRVSKDSTENSLTHSCDPLSTVAAVHVPYGGSHSFEDKPRAKFTVFKIYVSDDWMDDEWASSDGSLPTTTTDVGGNGLVFSASESITLCASISSEEGGASEAHEHRGSILSASTSIPATGSFRMTISEEDFVECDDADASLASVKERELQTDSFDDSFSLTVPVSDPLNTGFIGSTHIFMSWAAEAY